MRLSPLPVDAVLPELLDALRAAGSAVLRAPTGAGKTTRVPPALLDAGLAGTGKVMVVEPRRIAARAAARRMCDERGSTLGDEIGYRVRFESRAGPATRIEVVTTGVFLRMLQGDPFLDGVGAVVFDEFHERALDADLALAMTRRVQADARPDLRIVAMSATLDPAPLVRFLGGCPAVESHGRLHPVEIRHDAPPPHRRQEESVARAVAHALDATPGDVLVFLPGMGEILRARTALEPLAAHRGVELRILHGDLPPAEQDAALAEGGPRRVVLATNVAETSVTVPGVTAVVDTGTSRRVEFDPGIGLPRLVLAPISRAAADQRAGRAGRTAPGVCVRLWSLSDHALRPETEVPEIRRADLCGPALQLLAWGESDLHAFPWFEAPDRRALDAAADLLERLGANDAGRITDLGRAMAPLPVHPRLARLLVEGARLGVADLAATAAALLSERDPFERTRDGVPGMGTDLVARIDGLEDFARRGRAPAALRAGPARQVLQARDQIRRAVSAPAPDRGRRDARDVEAVEIALLAAFPDRVARRRAPGSDRAVMVGGRGVRLPETGTSDDPDLFLCIEADAGRRGERAEAQVRISSHVERGWLDPRAVATVWERGFDDEAGRVTATRVTRYLDLVLDEAATAPPDDEATAAALAGAAARDLRRALPLDDPSVAGLVSRVACLAEWMPDLGLPSLGDAFVADLLPHLCAGKRSFDELRRAPLLDHLRGALTHAQRTALDRHAPERIEVPSGSRVALLYEPGRPPVLAVRIQEVFGLAETPRVAGGRMPVVLHLLAPNRRPQQVTDDLASFWRNTYPVVRKELRARYPRHAWPEDPLSAPAERRPKPRRR